MYFLIDVDNNFDVNSKIVNEYYCQDGRYQIAHAAAKPSLGSKSQSSVTISEGMTNHSSSCWMICVLQALRASPSFRILFAPQPQDPNIIKHELFHIFDIVEGRNGQKKRQLRDEETRKFKELLIREGLPAKMDKGFLEEPFLLFLLKKLGMPNIEYRYGTSGKAKKEKILKMPLQEATEPRQLHTLMKERKIAFTSTKNVPEFLPIHLDRPEIQKSIGKGRYTTEFSRVPIVPSPALSVPVGKDGKMAQFRLVSIVIGRDSRAHAYSYTVEHDAMGREVWVEYNDSDVRIHSYPDSVKRRPTSNQTPLQDACKHAPVLIYQFIGYA
jgi:hypothetical protein